MRAGARDARRAYTGMVDKIMKRAGLFAAIQRKQQKILGFPAVLYLPFYIIPRNLDGFSREITENSAFLCEYQLI